MQTPEENGANKSKESILHQAFEACKNEKGMALNTSISEWLFDNYALKKDDISKNKTLVKVYESLGYNAIRNEGSSEVLLMKENIKVTQNPSPKKHSTKKSKPENSQDKSNRLFNFAMFPPSYESHIENLSKMAIQEEWGKKNAHLKQYIIERFYIISTSKPHLLCYTDDKTQTCFNTGLLTPHFQDIFAYFEKPQKGKRDIFIFKGFFNESAGQLSNFKELPDTIEFYTNIEEIYFDTTLEIRLNKDHILGDNIERFPDYFANLSVLQQGSLLDGLVKNMKIRLKRNYRTAIPQWYKNKVCFLLPLCLSGENINNPELLLTCEKKDGFYYIATCLTPEMAYTNARIIAKPESDWLKP